MSDWDFFYQQLQVSFKVLAIIAPCITVVLVLLWVFRRNR